MQQGRRLRDELRRALLTEPKRGASDSPRGRPHNKDDEENDNDNGYDVSDIKIGEKSRIGSRVSPRINRSVNKLSNCLLR
jgi:hypothetical protein